MDGQLNRCCERFARFQSALKRLSEAIQPPQCHQARNADGHCFQYGMDVDVGIQKYDGARI